MFRRIPIEELMPYLKTAVLCGSVLLFVFICWKVFRMKNDTADHLAAMPLDEPEKAEKLKQD